MPPVIPTAAAAAAAATAGATGAFVGTGLSVAAFGAGTVGIASAVAGVGIAATIGTVLKSVGTSILLSGVSGLLFKPDVPSLGLESEARGRAESFRSPLAPRRLIYGEVMVSGPIVYMEAYKKFTANKNDMLSVLYALAGHEVEQIGEIRFDDEVVPLDANGDATGFYAGFASVFKHLGASDQAADADLVADSQAGWSANHRLRGIAYVHQRLRFDSEKFPFGRPKLRALVKGRKVFDPRTSTTAWSDNAALCLRDYLTHPLGLGLAASDIDDDAVKAAANVCDEAVSLKGGGSEKRYTANGTILTDSRPADAIRALLSAMAGALVIQGGKWIMYAGAAGTASITLDEDDLRGPIVVNPRLGRRDIFNAVKAKYVDPNQEWQPTDAPPLTNAFYEAQDNGERIWRDVEFPFTTSAATAERLAKLQLERARQQITVEYPANLTALRIQPWDVIGVTNERYGWANKEFRVVGWQLSVDGGVDLLLREEAAAAWAWDPDADETTVDPAPDTNLPNPRTVATPGGITVTDSLEVTATGIVVTLMTITVTPAEDTFVGSYEVEFKKTTAIDYSSAGSGPGTVYEVVGVEDGTTYDIRARGVTSLGIKSPYVSVQYQVVGQTAPPADVANFAVNVVENTAHLSWDAVPDVDLSHYRIRFSPLVTGATWAGAVDLVPRVARPATAVSVPAAVGTYLIKAVDLKGIESGGATASVTTVAAIAGLNVVATQSEHPGFAGAKSNVVLVDGKLKLDTSNLFDSVAGNFDDALGLFDGGVGNVATSGTYTFASVIDLGSVFTSRVSATLKVGVEEYANVFDAAPGNFDAREGLFDGESPSDVNVALEVRTTEDDPGGSPTWSAYRSFVVGDYKARAFEFRATLTSPNANASPTVEQLSVEIDMPDRIAGARDLVTLTTGVLTVSYSPAFNAVPELGVTVKNMATDEKVVITSETAANFDIEVLDAASARQARNFNYLARGYGEAA